MTLFRFEDTKFENKQHALWGAFFSACGINWTYGPNLKFRIDYELAKYVDFWVDIPDGRCAGDMYVSVCVEPESEWDEDWEEEQEDKFRKLERLANYKYAFDGGLYRLNPPVLILAKFPRPTDIVDLVNIICKQSRDNHRLNSFRLIDGVDMDAVPVINTNGKLELMPVDWWGCIDNKRVDQAKTLRTYQKAGKMVYGKGMKQ